MGVPGFEEIVQGCRHRRLSDASCTRLKMIWTLANRRRVSGQEYSVKDQRVAPKQTIRRLNVMKDTPIGIQLLEGLRLTRRRGASPDCLT